VIYLRLPANANFGRSVVIWMYESLSVEYIACQNLPEHFLYTVSMPLAGGNLPALVSDNASVLDENSNLVEFLYQI